MTSIRAFKISHDWGDPREPEQRNGLPVSFASYSENHLYLRFKVFGIRMNDPAKIDWYLEAPPNTRAILGLRWAERLMIFQRVIDHLKNLEPIERWRVADSDFSSITVDVSKIAGVLPTIFSFLSKRLSTAGLYLPTPYIALTLSIGFLCVMVNSWNYYPQLNPSALKTFSFLLGIASLVQLIRSIQTDYKSAKIIATLQTLGNPKFNWRRLTFKIMVVRGRWRYSITLVLAIILVFLALSINA